MVNKLFFLEILKILINLIFWLKINLIEIFIEGHSVER